MPLPSPPRMPKRTTASHSTLAAMVGADIKNISRNDLPCPGTTPALKTGNDWENLYRSHGRTPHPNVTITANEQSDSRNQQGLYRTNAALKGLSLP